MRRACLVILAAPFVLAQAGRATAKPPDLTGVYQPIPRQLLFPADSALLPAAAQ
jgi:hypothetical protein